jgi:hypothetical protein
MSQDSIGGVCILLLSMLLYCYYTFSLLYLLWMDLVDGRIQIILSSLYFALWKPGKRRAYPSFL